MCRSEAGVGVTSWRFLVLYNTFVTRSHKTFSGESIAFLSPPETDAGITEYGEARQVDV